ncbi:hypothetical protein BDM02DRAFT_2663162 [Thelephora ganbajun]|uniref:Uncharacterized protein n=1 Tax=Thelephora ganbajun TaxID=370292 RepID=A0ACB6ZD76_THEGA|nr:hypothetical protein BDM02DRAFT_2663162 [Thelephora ganbajun]
MSTDATSAGKPVSSMGSTAAPTSAQAADKGKGKVEEVGEGEDEDDEEEDEEMDEEDDDDEDEFDEIDPTAVLPPGRRTRGIKVDYTSSEALRKAGLKPEDDAEEEGEDSFVHDDDAMKHQ